MPPPHAADSARCGAAPSSAAGCSSKEARPSLKARRRRRRHRRRCWEPRRSHRAYRRSHCAYPRLRIWAPGPCPPASAYRSEGPSLPCGGREGCHLAGAEAGGVTAPKVRKRAPDGARCCCSPTVLDGGVFDFSASNWYALRCVLLCGMHLWRAPSCPGCIRHRAPMARAHPHRLPQSCHKHFSPSSRPPRRVLCLPLLAAVLSMLLEMPEALPTDTLCPGTELNDSSRPLVLWQLCSVAVHTPTVLPVGGTR